MSDERTDIDIFVANLRIARERFAVCALDTIRRVAAAVTRMVDTAERTKTTYGYLTRAFAELDKDPEYRKAIRKYAVAIEKVRRGEVRLENVYVSASRPEDAEDPGQYTNLGSAVTPALFRYERLETADPEVERRFLEREYRHAVKALRDGAFSEREADRILDRMNEIKERLSEIDGRTND